jgi:D-alanyl-lipoteichoic acid acyltransferase DltB (MBOAT superfamily)
MLFNSINFAIFLPFVFLFYWLAFNKNAKLQNLFLLVASYFFYAWWDWRYLSLVLLCSATNYVGGLMLMRSEQEKQRKIILLLCCTISLGVLGLFKYYNFFVTSLVETFAALNIHLGIRTLNLILPVGISFYTFHTLSYTIDVYRRKFEPTKDIISFFLFVSIFPLAMAGPIERATNLLPQIYKSRQFDYLMAIDGMRQILWGLFKKIVIADGCSEYVNTVFEHYQTQSGSTLLLGTLFFTIQIYGDFSGYSDMALGIGKLLGFKFLRNFNNPYFSRDIAEFWRKWHISLTTWFRDYLYIPLGGSRGSKWLIIRNTFIIFLVSGFWHGANYTFIVWGTYHAVLFLPLILTGKNRKYTDTIAEGKMFSNWKECCQMITTFFLVSIGWILFRADTIHQAWFIIRHIFSPTLFSIPSFQFPAFFIKSAFGIGIATLYIPVLFATEWLQRKKQHGLQIDNIKSAWIRGVIYLAIAASIFYYYLYFGQQTTFIYFQF